MNVIVDECLWRIEDSQPRQARRLFHGRGHAYPGYEHMVVNWFDPYVQISAYAPLSSEHIDELQRALITSGCGIEGIVLQQRDGRRTDTQTLFGSVPDEHVVQEAGLNFIVQPKRNQNVGLFLDMSHVRVRIAEYMAGKRVLNLFAYTCAFSVSALAQGAVSVVNNDMSRNALEWGERNHVLNDHDLRKVRMLPHNLFKSWWKIRQFGPYDAIVIDPPTNQRGSFVAEKQYGQVLKRIPDLAAPGAIVVACLNSPFLDPEFLTGQIQRWCPSCDFIEQVPAHSDFPEQYPDRGLKVLLYRYRP
jgi:23S rRNA (cytosine1962-C5)-methyltransferase